MPAFRRVLALVDWNAQIKNCRVESMSDLQRQADYTIRMTSRVIASALLQINNSTRYKVSMRLYHGWHKGFTETARRIAAVSALASTDYAALSASSIVAFDANVGFGDVLLDALPRRLMGKPPLHLPGTLRRADRRRDYGEKMVDTAIASDLLSFARSEPGSIAMVVAEDTDFVPPIFTAEAWMVPAGGGAFIVRAGNGGGAILSLDEIVIKGRWNGRIRPIA